MTPRSNDAAASAAGITAGYSATPTLRDVSIDLPAGACTAIVGPNGSGKSTLLRVLAGLLRPAHGSVTILGDDAISLAPRARARRMALLAQGPTPPEHLTVRQLVEQGRYAHAGPLGMLRTQTSAEIDEALDAVGIAHLADRLVHELSGGERQRAWLAMTLAQSAPLLLLDEPTTFLDLGHQLEVLELLDRLRRQRRLTIVAVLHDLNHALAIAEQLVVVAGGRIVAVGPPADVVTAELLREVFGVTAHLGRVPATGRPFVVPLAPLDRPTR